jgi:hypothetical protein
MTQMTILWQGDKVDVDIEATPGVYAPAKLSGRPEDCHPDESENPEIISIKLSETGEEILPKLSKSEIQALESKLVDREVDAPFDEPDDFIGDDDWQGGQDAWEASHA